MHSLFERLGTLISEISVELNNTVLNNYPEDNLKKVEELTKLLEESRELFGTTSKLMEIKNGINHLYTLSNKQKHDLACKMSSFTEVLYIKLCKKNLDTANLLDKNKSNIHELKEDLENTVEKKIDNDEPVKNYINQLKLKQNIDKFEELNFGFNIDYISSILFDQKEPELMKISYIVVANENEISNRLYDIEERLKSYKKGTNTKSNVIKGIAATFLIATFIVSMSTCGIEKKDNIDKGLVYLESNGYETLVPYYLSGEMKNIECADLYITYSKKYDLNIDIVIGVIDEIVFSYLESDRQNVSSSEIEDTIDETLKNIENKQNL